MFFKNPLQFIDFFLKISIFHLFCSMEQNWVLCAAGSSARMLTSVRDADRFTNSIV